MWPTWCGPAFRRSISARGWKAISTLDQLREVWMAISPVNYMDKFARNEEVQVYLHDLRHDVSAGVFQADNLANPPAGDRSRGGGAALRALHHGRIAVQIRGWISYLLVLEEVALAKLSEQSQIKRQVKRQKAKSKSFGNFAVRTVVPSWHPSPGALQLPGNPRAP